MFVARTDRDIQTCFRYVDPNIHLSRLLRKTTSAPPNLVLRAVLRSCRCPGSSDAYGTATHALRRPRTARGGSVCRAVVFLASGDRFSTRLTSSQSPPPRPHLLTTAAGSLRAPATERHTRGRGWVVGGAASGPPTLPARVGAAENPTKSPSPSVSSVPLWLNPSLGARSLAACEHPAEGAQR